MIHSLIIKALFGVGSLFAVAVSVFLLLNPGPIRPAWNGSSLRSSFDHSGRPHLLTLPVEEGETLKVTIEQLGQDVFLRLEQDASFIAIDHQLTISEPEILWFPVRKSGTVQLLLNPVGTIDRDDGYSLQITRFRSPRETRIGKAFYQWQYLAHPNRAKPDQAWAQSLRSLSKLELEKIWLQTAGTLADAGCKELAARSLIDLALWLARDHKLDRSQAAYNQARILLKGPEPNRWALLAERQLARVLRSAGDYPASLEACERAIQIARDFGDYRQLGVNHNSSGLAYAEMGYFEDAVTSYRAAVTAYEVVQAHAAIAQTWLNLGIAMGAMGLWHEAEANFEKARTFWAQVEDHGNEADAELELAWVAHRQGHFELAIERYQKAIRTLQNTQRRPAGIFDRWGSTLLQLGRFEEAREKYSESLALFSQNEDETNQARVMVNLANLELLRGDTEASETWLVKGHALFESRGEVPSMVNALRLMARLESEKGDGSVAAALLANGRDMLDELRSRLKSAHLQRPFNAVHYDLISDSVRQIMSNYGRSDKREEALAALSVLEHQRALSLRSSLTRNHPDQNHRRATTIQSIQGQPEDRVNVTNGNALPNADLGGRALPRNYSLTELQAFLDEDEVCLVFSLHERASYVWELTRNHWRVHSWPGRVEVESVVIPLYRSLRKPAANPIRKQLEGLTKTMGKWLSDSLELAPEKPSWILVPEGCLNLVAWGTLPDPKGGLIVQHRRLSLLPSLSSGLDLARREQMRPSAARRLLAVGGAVYQDPGLTKTDELVGVAMPSSLSDRLGAAKDSYQNLPFSREEVLAIGSLVPESSRRLLLGYQATPQELTDLGRYQILHFATHAEHHSEFGDRSSLVLSTIDALGRPTPGRLRVFDMRTWQLNADLVTLSACQTGLGQSFRGEGVWGLSQALMVAGASRLIVSLWPVADESTMHLMVAFYRYLLEEGFPPAESLRRAQETLIANPATADPYQWAGFQLQGLSGSISQKN